MEIQGHRGFGKLAPFNSLRAFHLASKLGLQSVEFDIRILKDNTIIVSHGPEIGDGNIESHDWDVVKNILIDEIEFEAPKEDDDSLEGIWKHHWNAETMKKDETSISTFDLYKVHYKVMKLHIFTVSFLQKFREINFFTSNS